jgi:hypothetical protein
MSSYDLFGEELFVDLSLDEESHDLRGPTANSHESCVSKESFNGIISGVAGSTKYLKCITCYLNG